LSWAYIAKNKEVSVQRDKAYKRDENGQITKHFGIKFREYWKMKKLEAVFLFVEIVCLLRRISGQGSK